MKKTTNRERGTMQRERRQMFIQAYQEHRAAIFRYIFYRVGNQQTADDLTADVFERLVSRYRHDIRDTGRILPWLYAVARNLVIDHGRRAGKVKWQELPEDAAADERSSPVHQTNTQLTNECLGAALEYLTEDQKQVVLLKFMERRSNREIGDLLGKTEGAVKGLQFRAMASLRRAIEKDRCYEA